MPKLISDARYRKLLEDQKLLRILEQKQPTKEVNNKAIEAIEGRLKMLELAVVQLAKVLNPSVTDVESALQTASKFGGRK